MAGDEKKIIRKHTVNMEQREKIFVTGVIDVLSFDEETITAETDYGMLVLKGAGLHVIKLDLDNGELDIEGEIDTLMYEEQGTVFKSKGSLLSKMFR